MNNVIKLGLLLAGALLFTRQFFRDPEDGTLSYGEAVKNLFLSLLIGFGVSMLASALIFGNDQELNTAYKEHSIQAGETGARMGAKMMGASEAEIEQAVETIREQYENGEVAIPEAPYAFSNLPMNLLVSAVMSIILALILAIFVKKNDKTAIA